MCHDASSNINATHLGDKNQVSNVSRLPQDGSVFQAGFSSTGSNVLLCLRQLNMSLMNDIIRKLTLPGVQVMHRCASAFSAAKTCMLLPLRRRFVGCNVDTKCVTLGLSKLALVFARQVLNNKSDTTADGGVQQTAFTFIKSMK